MNGAALIPRSALFTIAATTSWKVADNKEKQFWKAVAKGCKVQ